MWEKLPQAARGAPMPAGLLPASTCCLESHRSIQRHPDCQGMRKQKAFVLRLRVNLYCFLFLVSYRGFIYLFVSLLNVLGVTVVSKMTAVSRVMEGELTLENTKCWVERWCVDLLWHLPQHGRRHEETPCAWAHGNSVSGGFVLSFCFPGWSWLMRMKDGLLSSPVKSLRLGA